MQFSVGFLTWAKKRKPPKKNYSFWNLAPVKQYKHVNDLFLLTNVSSIFLRKSMGNIHYLYLAENQR